MVGVTDERAGPDARQLLVDWANAQDHWVRAIVAEVLATRREVVAEALGRAYSLLLAEKELSSEILTPVPALGTNGGTEPGTAPLRLTCLSEVRNVNALTPDQTVTFNPRLTVCFGENAAGKTGYVRIFKRLAAVRSAEPILGNIHRVSGAPPHAKLAYDYGSGTTTYEWNDETGVLPFTRMAVFDAGAVRLHVDDDLAYVYTPSDLALFRYTHAAIENVKARLETARTEAQARTNPFLARFARDTPVYPKIESLGAATNLAELQQLGTVTPEEAATLAPLREKVEALRPESVEARLRLARADRDVYRALESAARTAAGFNWTAYADAVAQVGVAAARQEEATERAFRPEEIPGGFSDAWRAFLLAGEKYLDDLHRPDYPHDQDVCIYCRQPLSAAAMALLRKYREFSSGTFREALLRAQTAVDTLSRPLVALELGNLKPGLDQRADGGTPVVTRGLALVEQVRAVQDAIGRRVPVSAIAVSGVAGEVVRLASTEVARAEELVKGLSTQAEERERLHRAESATLRALEARVTLQTLLADVTSFVKRAQWAVKAGTLISSRFPTVLRSLTDESKQASELLLNQDFERRFTTECTALKAPSVKLDFPGRKAEPARRKRLDADHPLSAILSEGEQKVIALADFLAEASLRRVSAPLVFDDPVTSLDQKRMRYVADRLFELSRENQVVIFTHNIWFVVEVLGRFETAKTECSYYEVREQDGVVGMVSAGTGPRWDTPNATAKRINPLIESANQASGEERDALVERAYDLLRGWCEMVVEQDLLRSVSQRFTPNIMMTKLKEIHADRLPAAVDVIVPVFEKACRYMGGHSQPLDTLAVRPSLDELRADWERVKKARKEYLA
jgi:hypothetical protein